MKGKQINSFIYLFFCIIFFEFATKYLIFKTVTSIGTVLLFSLFYIVIFSLFSGLFSEKLNKKIFFGIIIIMTFWFEFQYVFYALFNIPFSFFTISLASQAFDFFDIALGAIWSNLFGVILLLIPLSMLILLNKKLNFAKLEKNKIIICLGCCIISYGFSLVAVMVNRNTLGTLGYLYFNVNNQVEVIEKFGILSATKIDLRRIITKFEEKIIIDEDISEENLPEDYGFNEVYDFDDILEKETNNNLIMMHQYFNTIEATDKNEYTGRYKGKNLIFILAEGFNSIAVDKSLTPTLYEMVNSSFVFENFYSPVFLSTTGGEFQATLGLIPTMSILNTYTKSSQKMMYGLGNALGSVGYNTQGYHNWTYTYYKRNISMNSLGFTNYIGCGNGMEKLIDCKWLPSDIAMFDKTLPLYVEKEPFVTYYVTVSGHAPYVLSEGNNIARKNMDLVSHLEYNKAVKAYLATQIELDRALESLLSKLEEYGELDNTVIALVGDHYPYTLSIDDINSISNYDRDEVIEANKSNFILWSNDTKKTVISKVGSQIDVLPTLLNLFGVEYDSRLIVGKDILSSAQGLAIFSNRSWVSDIGHYYVKGNKFIAKEGFEPEEDYVNIMNRRVANSFTISENIIKNRYYEKILEKY